MGRLWSGQTLETVNLPALCLHRFESCPAHHLDARKGSKTPKGVFVFIAKIKSALRTKALSW
jgi:hypothetical protein